MATLPPDLLIERIVICLAEFPNTFKSEVKQTGRFSTIDNKSKEHVYIIWNVTGIIDEEEEVEEPLKERDITTTLISRTEKITRK
jgi:hypothetical protein